MDKGKAKWEKETYDTNNSLAATNPSTRTTLHESRSGRKLHNHTATFNVIPESSQCARFRSFPSRPADPPRPRSLRSQPPSTNTSRHPISCQKLPGASGFDSFDPNQPILPASLSQTLGRQGPRPNYPFPAANVTGPRVRHVLHDIPTASWLPASRPASSWAPGQGGAMQLGCEVLAIGSGIGGRS